MEIVSPPPQITIIPYGANVILAWPANAAAFVLQSTTNLDFAGLEHRFARAGHRRQPVRSVHAQFRHTEVLSVNVKPVIEARLKQAKNGSLLWTFVP